jgi:hypothetical protein
MRFHNRERVLVSVASTPEHSIKVFKLIAGIFPLRTIWEYKARAVSDKDARRELITLLLGKAGKKTDHPLDAMIRKLALCRSCDEAARVLRQAERDAREGA